jgi:hypothetical protein
LGHQVAFVDAPAIEFLGAPLENGHFASVVMVFPLVDMIQFI